MDWIALRRDTHRLPHDRSTARGVTTAIRRKSPHRARGHAVGEGTDFSPTGLDQARSPSGILKAPSNWGGRGDGRKERARRYFFSPPERKPSRGAELGEPTGRRGGGANPAAGRAQKKPPRTATATA